MTTLKDVDDAIELGVVQLRRAYAEIERLRAAIRRHRSRVWGSTSPVGNDADDELYGAVEQRPAMRNETDERYNAAEVAAIQHELIGGLDRERLDRTPWARSIVTKLVKRIAHLRARVAELEAADKR